MAAQAVRGLFIGLSTVDVVYRIEALPTNAKSVASAQAVFAGGPATNAVIAFAALGGHGTLGSSLGNAAGRSETAELRTESPRSI